MEKSSQVTMMAYIFSAAKAVLAWLGDGDYSELFALLNNAVRMAVATTTLRSAINLVSLSGGLPDSSPSCNVRVELTNCLLSLFDLLRSPWFSRVWILQEVKRAKVIRILSGTGQANWETLSDFLLVAKAHCVEHAHNVKPLRIAYRVFWLRATGRHLTTSELILAGNHSQSTKPVDQIYALLALAPDVKPSSVAKQLDWPLVVDYSLPTVEVYHDTTLRAIMADRQLDVLRLLARGPRMASLPSWVPDYSLYTTALELSYFRHMRRPGYSLDVTRFPALMESDRSRKLLSLQGVDLGILSTTDLVLTATADGGERAVYRSWLNHAVVSVVEAARTKEMAAFCNTVFLGDSALWSRISIPISLSEALSSWADDLRGTLSAEHNPVVAQAILQVSYSISCSCEGKRFATTQEGDFCIVPEESKPGDVLLILGGGRLPFVARLDGSFHRLIGECFVQGKNLNAIMEQGKQRSYDFL